MDFCPSCFHDEFVSPLCHLCGAEYRPEYNFGDILDPGQILSGIFKIGRLLGRGGFGATYLALDQTLNVRVAIKEFLPQNICARGQDGVTVYPNPATREDFEAGLRQFLSEARTLAQFRNDPGIVSVLQFFEQNNTGYMVMEHLDGQTLERHLASRRRLSAEEAINLLLPVCQSLERCHAVNLIHRDISPDNIFVTKDDHIKLLDFGAARFAAGGRSLNLSVVLKEGFAPFEQYQTNGAQGPWTDVYALTGTLYRLITGALPVPAPDRIGGTELVYPSEAEIAVPGGFEDILHKGLALDPAQRYQTVAALEQALRDCMSAGLPAPKVPFKSVKREAIRVTAGPVSAALSQTVQAGEGGGRHGRLPLIAATGVGAAAVAAFFIYSNLGRPMAKPTPQDAAAAAEWKVAGGSGPVAHSSAVKNLAVNTVPANAPAIVGANPVDLAKKQLGDAIKQARQLHLAAFRLASHNQTLHTLLGPTGEPAPSEAKVVSEVRRAIDSATSDQQNYLASYASTLQVLATSNQAAVEEAISAHRDRLDVGSPDRHFLDLIATHLTKIREETLGTDEIVYEISQ
ncbi:serine/threonine-protein kinase [Azospirillum sp. B4]|uniref:serine/threonine protein kinase n=1 Tax=Azospirillum sp. B4 TaxID=95605 RepID=UPI00034C4812|nr:serine/threonine-protein kinase [Azospirillum sp. B4]